MRKAAWTVEGNQLLARLPRPLLRRLVGLATPVPLVLSAELCQPGETMRHVYFPRSGFISLLVATPGHPSLEVGMVGREGMLGAHVALGVPGAPLRALVQGAGECLRLPAATFRRELAAAPALTRRVHRYVHVLMTQLAGSAGCVRFHEIVPRLARWLLMSLDRAGGDRIEMTHEFLAYMLGVRRVGVTVAAGGLQSKGLISYHRGHLQVLDRKGLEALACACYGADRALYTATLS